MKRFRRLAVIIFSFFVLFTNVFFNKAQNNSEWVFDHWNNDKDNVFKLANEQDKYIFLFVGLQNCSSCERISSIFANPENRLSAFIDDTYIPWVYKLINTNIASIPDDTIKKFINEILNIGATTLPFLFIINPEFPDCYVKWLAGNDIPVGPSSITILQELITVDLLTDSDQTWHKDKDKDKVFSLAKEQNKNIFKLIGKGTSPNSQKVMQQLTGEPLKELLDKNYILWYSADVSEVPAYNTPILPYITIIDTDNPDNPLDETFGYQEVTVLEEIIKSHIVSNEIIASDHIVIVSGNVLHIANRTVNEQIQVFTLTGQQIATIRKNDYTVQIDASNFPKGVLIVHSSKGWTQKIIVHN